MRLLTHNNNGELSLTEFLGENTPPYAILSHTWGREEVTFADLSDGIGKEKAGYDKIKFCGERARCDGLQYFWVDSCCIDKTSSNELTEAINSMFRWYSKAAKCYVYLSDVSCPSSEIDNITHAPSWETAFRTSRWFTRGWTLQELIAPRSVEFFSREGSLLGNKESLERQICEITSIPVKALGRSTLSEFSIAERMSWMEHRETTRGEDKAYSMLGILNINMSSIYGEGMENAFDRLLDKLENRSKKRQHSELFAVTQNVISSTKRLKTAHSHSPSVLSHSGTNDTKSCVVHNIDYTTKEALIDMLHFDKIDERLTSLTAAQGSTCRWFLDKSEYISWHDAGQQSDHGGFLWIKGNPGTGKSTLMKLLFEEEKLYPKSHSSQITLSFFFLARGTIEEKSTIGLYRSLLHQLLEKAPDLSDCLDWMTANGARGIERSGWHEQALKQTLAKAIQKLKSRPLTIFVDALDECDKSKASGMVSFFEELCDIAKANQAYLKICFSSRHYPTITIQNGIEVTLENEGGHTEDIKQYVKAKLKIGKSKQAESLRSDVLEKSSGIFLWVALVVDIINSEYPDKSISIKKIRERLREIPPELNDLFEMILTRDGENLERMQICLKFILFARRPLKPQELYFATQIGLDQSCSGRWDREDVELGNMKTFVKSSSKGLAEVTRNKASEVQFIHESVRDFLLHKYEGQLSEHSEDFMGRGHELIKNCCVAQLNASISQDVSVPDPLPQASEAAHLREEISSKFPFLEYSIRNVFYHADSAQQTGVDQSDFLAKLLFQQWILLYNILEKFEIRRYTKSVSFLYVLAESNCADLIRILPTRRSCFDVGNERYGPPIFAALATESGKAACALLEAQAEIRPLVYPRHDLYVNYCQDRKTFASFGRSFRFPQRKSVSSITSYIPDSGHDILFWFLINSGKLNANCKHRSGQPYLSWAAEKGFDGMVKVLIENKADVNAQGGHYENALQTASANGHETVVELLLKNNADVNAQGGRYGNALQTASANGHETVVKLLLKNNANVNAYGGHYGNALQAASHNGREAIAKLLLERNADVNAKGGVYGNALQAASHNGREAIAKMLLERNADVSAKGGVYGNALYAASHNGHEAVVKLLLERNADVSAKGGVYGNALQAASVHGHEAIVKLLLEHNAEVSAKGGVYGNALQAASVYGHEAIVKLLLENNADVNAQEGVYGNALQAASHNGHEAVVKLLLENKADVNAQGGVFGNALQAASVRLHRAVMRLLGNAMTQGP